MTDPSSPKPKKLLDQLRDAIRIKHYANSTEKTYIHWAKRYILFHNKRHPAEMGVPENILHVELDAPIHALRAKRAQHLPTVLSRDEAARVLAGMQGLHQLMARLLCDLTIAWLRPALDGMPAPAGQGY